jgi:hypothetical protein
VVGFDVERHIYGEQKYPAQLVLQDVLTLDGRQFRGRASVIVASPPCQEYSYMAMPWPRAKQIAMALCDGVSWFPPRYDGSRTVEELNRLFLACFRIAKEAELPLVVENVKGAQPWVGRAKANFGSFYLWGDVASVGGRIMAGPLQFGQTVRPVGGIKQGGDWFGPGEDCSISRRSSSHSKARKAASAQIAKIPLPLAQYIARVFKPVNGREEC